jgi:hypothetical protein
LSWGAIFLVCLIVGTVAYCGFGCYHRRKHEEGLSYGESIPHGDFWREIPALVTDGCHFSYSKIKGLISRTETPSSEI